MPPSDLRIVFLGMICDSSTAVLEVLLAAGLQVCAVVVAAARGAAAGPIAALAPPRAASPLAIASPFLERNIAHLAWERGVATFELRQPGAPEARQALADLRPDLACVACFPRRIPAPLLAVPRLGFLNMHPSLLPAHRGPEPLFWTFRAGERQAGATIHFMDEGLDTGDIVAQAPLDLPDGISGAAAERRCAMLGGRLMAEALAALAAGALERRPQPPGGSYESWPGPQHWRIGAEWPARRAFNFMRGTAEWRRPYIIDAGGRELLIEAAIDYDADASLGVPLARVGDEVRIQCAPGVLRARAG
ncbi:MAG: hypothetical protein IPO81_28205 [Kouleothrix sp.]|nr:hypothetical protein [Kouleothrix sp.]